MMNLSLKRWPLVSLLGLSIGLAAQTASAAPGPGGKAQRARPAAGARYAPPDRSRGPGCQFGREIGFPGPRGPMAMGPWAQRLGGPDRGIGARNKFGPGGPGHNMVGRPGGPRRGGPGPEMRRGGMKGRHGTNIAIRRGVPGSYRGPGKGMSRGTMAYRGRPDFAVGRPGKLGRAGPGPAMERDVLAFRGGPDAPMARPGMAGPGGPDFRMRGRGFSGRGGQGPAMGRGRTAGSGGPDAGMGRRGPGGRSGPGPRSGRDMQSPEKDREE